MIHLHAFSVRPNCVLCLAYIWEGLIVGMELSRIELMGVAWCVPHDQFYWVVTPLITVLCLSTSWRCVCWNVHVVCWLVMSAVCHEFESFSKFPHHCEVIPWILLCSWCTNYFHSCCPPSMMWNYSISYFFFGFNYRRQLANQIMAD